MTENHIPKFLRGVRIQFDKVRSIYVMLGPERALMLDTVSYEILSKVDGENTIKSIIDDLKKKIQSSEG